MRFDIGGVIMRNEIVEALKEMKEKYDSKKLLIFFLQIWAWAILSVRNKLEDVVSLDEYFHTKVSLASINEIFYKLSKIYPDSFTEIGEIDNLDIVRLLSLFVDANARDVSFSELCLLMFYDIKEGMPVSYNLSLEKFIYELIKTVITENSSVYLTFTNVVIPSLIGEITGNVFIEDTYDNEQLINLYNIIYSTKFNYKKGNPITDPGFFDEKAPHILKEFDFGIVNLLRLPMKQRFSLNVDKYNRFKVSDIKNLTFASLIEHSIKQVKKKIIVMVPNGFLFKTISVEKDIKKYLTTNNLIETVIRLPKNLFYTPYETVSIIVLNKNKKDGNVHFIETGEKRFYKTERRKNILVSHELVEIIKNKEEIENVSRIVGKEEIGRKKYNLNPVIYSLSKEYIELDRIILGIKGVALREIVDFVRPIHVPEARTSSYITIYEVTTKNIPPFGYIKDFVERRVDENFKMSSKLFLKPYDILLAIRGDIARVGIMPSNIRGKFIAIQSLQIIRVNRDDINPHALYMYLKTEIIRKYLKRRSVGDILPTLKLSDLYEIPFPVEKQEYFEKLFEKEIELYTKKEELEKEIEKLRIYPA